MRGLMRLQLIALSCLMLIGMASASGITLGHQEAARIGEKVFHNECAGKASCLTSWNQGEAFPSLGIGHFIWYPERITGPFKESFPALVAFMQARNVQIPAWLQKTTKTGAPWPTRDHFLAAQTSQRMQQLRTLLANSKDVQTAFMVERLNRALPRMLASIPAPDRASLEVRFQQVANAPMGYYALIDYVNFKGEGIAPSERYQGQGWGLLQVLQEMEETDDPVNALINFSASAQRVLQRRVKLSPPERHERRWLAGWNKRVTTYAP